MTTIADPNEHILNYLQYYFSLKESPHFAVLLTGAWGIGKTHVIKRALAPTQRGPSKTCYVSLFGVATRQDVDLAIYRALYPAVFSDTAQKVTHGIGKLAKMVRLDFGGSEIFLNRFGAKIYVFDDLERAEMPINQMMGYINAFVEHENCWVVIVANEASIGSNEEAEYRRRKEKLVGKTLEVQPAFDDALPSFLRSLGNSEVQKFVEAHKEHLRRVFTESGIRNLRVLHQSLLDFERLYEAVPKEYRAKHEGLVVLFVVFMALSFEFRVGNISASDLAQRSERADRVVRAREHMRELRSGETSQDQRPAGLSLAQTKYPTLNLADALLPSSVASDLLVRGMVDKAGLEVAIRSSAYFVAPDQEPAWRVVWGRDLHEEQDVESAINEMERQFASREFTLPGEVLHVLGLRLTLATSVLIPKTVSEVVAEGKAYIDDLRAEGRLIPPADEGPMAEFFGAYGGLGFSSSKTPEFGELATYLEKARELAEKATHPAKAQQLLQDMAVDTSLFWRRINFGNNSDSAFGRTPLFADMNVDHFISDLMKLKPAGQREVLMAIRSRYDGDRLNRDLKEERPFVESLVAGLQKLASEASPIVRARIENFVKGTIGELSNPAGD